MSLTREHLLILTFVVVCFVIGMLPTKRTKKDSIETSSKARTRQQSTGIMRPPDRR